ncbi:hypothetical protein EDEG_00653 [Edhazardia aedis USNM 41457]|uniref:Uncharacterized protein n=1 Tax=Edhazardia aedis (strain USNM 41457) TaxID=1003232 RepID=J9DRU9_EDHAE|nr:hypothetical protein EDEG_00653 [Edhazardia aedis USNM 41457]|eukprot:EJW05295.1 hypothetical protein EDEG_00653 [Edhazardia aedis USNM 41457]
MAIGQSEALVSDRPTDYIVKTVATLFPLNPFKKLILAAYKNVIIRALQVCNAEQMHKYTKHPEKTQRMDYPSRNNPGSQSLPLINKHSLLNSLSFCLYVLLARRTNVSQYVYGINIPHLE